MGTPHKLIDVQIQGTEQAKANLRAIAENMPLTLANALMDEMGDTMMESQAECPYDYDNPHTGPEDGPHLRDTAAVGQDVDAPNDQVVIYGSYTQKYAVYVHEIMENRHLYPTKAKFLEDPANRRAKVLLQNLSMRMRASIEGTVNQPVVPFTSPWSFRKDYKKWVEGVEI